MAETITALATIALALVTLWLAAVTKRLARVSEEAAKRSIEVAQATIEAAQATARAELFAYFIRRWDRTQMRKRRARLASEIAERRVNSRDDLPPDRILAPVADFFEEMGLCLRQRLLDDEFIWEMFGEWAIYYWKLCGEQYAKTQKQIRPSVYDNYQQLISMIERKDKERGEQPNRLVDPKEIIYFLDEERGAVD
jgi:hypothetical protein